MQHDTGSSSVAEDAGAAITTGEGAGAAGGAARGGIGGGARRAGGGAGALMFCSSAINSAGLLHEVAFVTLTPYSRRQFNFICFCI